VSELAFKDISETAALIRKRETSPTELLNAVIEAMSRAGSRLNCYVTIDEQGARRKARRLERLLRSGVDLGPLHGVPISVKDNIETAGLRTTAGSPLLAKHVPERDATVIRKLRAAGAVVFAKANLHSFAFGAPHPDFGAVGNPWSSDATAGGSSSGSASAVAAGLCYASIGTDTGGSIRIPAAFCGVVGLKPTYGRVGRRGAIPLSYSLDCIGPLTRSVTDAAIVLRAIAGVDDQDPTAAPAPVPDYVAECSGGVQGLRIGIPARQPDEEPAPECAAAVAEVARELEAQGAQLREVQLPDYTEAVIVKTAIYSAEAAEYHRDDLDARRSEYSHPLLALLDTGRSLPAIEYIRSHRIRQQMTHALENVFRQVDVILLPTVPSSPSLTASTSDPAVISRYTSLFSVAGLPAVSIPIGLTADGLPLAAQLVGAAFAESTILRTAWAYEKARPWSDRRPDLGTWTVAGKQARRT
jgi:Asp-tRNA(Asn)/Glu-tRNA(Gln) amidotransferase A subunit family amidase